jgi:hypothetical protein
MIGTWSVFASWAGDTQYNGATSDTVQFSVSTSVVPVGMQYWSPIFGYDYSAVKLRNSSENTVSALLGVYNSEGTLVTETTIEVLPRREVVTLNRIGNLYQYTNPGSVEVIPGSKSDFGVSILRWNTGYLAADEFEVQPVEQQALEMFWFIVPKPGNPYIAITNPNAEEVTVALRIYSSSMELKVSQLIPIPAHGERTIDILSYGNPGSLIPAVVKLLAPKPVVVRYPNQKDY